MVGRFVSVFGLLAAILSAETVSAAPDEETRSGFPRWGWPLIMMGVVLVVILSGWPWDRDRQNLRRVGNRESTSPPEGPARKAPSPVVPQTPPDDLKRIEGIGPKISALIAQRGITTFQQLADTGTDHLRQILDDAGITIANPATWPEQASLAARGDWARLKELQSQLKGGRRV